MRMQKILPLLVCAGFCCLAATPVSLARHRSKDVFLDNHPTLPLGAAAPDFHLKGVDDKYYGLGDFRSARILVIVFTCNHCPTAQAYENRLIQLSADYKGKGVALLAIMPNDPRSVQLAELGYTDMGDTFEEMKKRAQEKQFNFPYLFDGDTEATAKAYGPVATPHVFIFDQDRKLRYQGRIDDMEKPTKTPVHIDTRHAIDELLAGKQVSVSSTKVFGCSIKWQEKSDWKIKAQQQWAGEPVNTTVLDEKGIREIMQNHSDKLRLINVWATWCGPCLAEFPDLITMYHMYRGRDFELVTISADDPAKREKVLQFLQKAVASNTNYTINTDDKYNLIEAVDPNWQGALPYTLLVEPGGKIVFSKQGEFDPDELKRAIVDNPRIGRYY